MNNNDGSWNYVMLAVLIQTSSIEDSMQTEPNTTLLYLNRSVLLVSISWAPTLQISSKALLQQWNVVLLNNSWMPQWASILVQLRSASLSLHCFIKTWLWWLLWHKRTTFSFWHLLVLSPSNDINFLSPLWCAFALCFKGNFAEGSVLQYYHHQSLKNLCWGQSQISRFV